MICLFIKIFQYLCIMKKIDIVGQPQEKNHTCGCACFRTVLNSFGLNDVDENDLIPIMNTNTESGTHYNSMVEVGSKFNLQVQTGNNGTLDILDNLINDGWIVIICYSIDSPHYSVYMGNNGKHLFLYDPDVDKKISYPVKNFVNSNWKVDIKLFEKLIKDYDLKLNTSHNSEKWWVAYKN